MEKPEGKILMSEFLGRAGASEREHGTSMFSDKMMEMMGSFTIIRMVNLMGAISEKISKEELLSLNEKLNQIKK